MSVGRLFQVTAGLAALTVATALVSSPARAIPYYEVDDAGELIAEAQFVGGGVDVIHGDIGGFRDADLFLFHWGGGAFVVDTLGSAMHDTILFLFDAAGRGIWKNDEVASGVKWSQIVDPDLSAGHYALGVSPWNYYPTSDPSHSSSGAIFPSAFTGQWGPVNDLPLDHWDLYHASPGGAYVINIRTPTAVPEPPTLALFGAALAVLGFASRQPLVRWTRGHAAAELRR
jgi:hypothetical protein